jgi:Xaa-Pro aminopeptidase
MKTNGPTLSVRERDRRWRLTRELMKEKNVECLIVAGLQAREQLDGYYTNDAVNGVVIFPLEGEPTCLTWSGSIVIRHIINIARGGVPWVKDIRVGALAADWVAVLEEKGFQSSTIGVVGLETQGPGQYEGYIPYKTWDYVINHLPKAKFVDVSKSLFERIMVNSEEEIALIRYSAQIGEMACEAMMKVVKPGVSENQIYATIMQVIYANGGSALPPTLILQSGVDNPTWISPMWTYQAQPIRTLQEGDLLQTEMFPQYGGKDTQQQMSVSLKPVHPVIQECAKVARRCYEAGLKMLFPGRKFQEVLDAMEAVVAEAGCWHPSPLIHSLNPQMAASGSTQVRIEQMPGIENYKGIKSNPSRGGDLVLKPGMVFEVEPNACTGKHRVNMGGPVLITATGPEELNKLPTDLRFID